jgi:hypothetical protein
MNRSSRWLHLRTAAAGLGFAAGLFLLMATFMAATSLAAPTGPGIVLPDRMSAPAAPRGIVALGDYVWHDPNANGLYDSGVFKVSTPG